MYKKNVVYICIIVLGLGYAGYSFLPNNNSKNSNSNKTFVSNRRAASDNTVQKSIKKTRKEISAEKTGIIKKPAKANKRSLKKKPGRRNVRKTKKKEISPSV